MEDVHHVIVGSEKGTTFPAIINQTVCNVLIDTSASRSCISEAFYKQLNLPPIQELKVHVRSATSGSLSPYVQQPVLFNWVKKSLLTLLLCVIIF